MRRKKIIADFRNFKTQENCNSNTLFKETEVNKLHPAVKIIKKFLCSKNLNELVLS